MKRLNQELQTLALAASLVLPFGMARAQDGASSSNAKEASSSAGVENHTSGGSNTGNNTAGSGTTGGISRSGSSATGTTGGTTTSPGQGASSSSTGNNTGAPGGSTPVGGKGIGSGPEAVGTTSGYQSTPMADRVNGSGTTPNDTRGSGQTHAAEGRTITGNRERFTNQSGTGSFEFSAGADSEKYLDSTANSGNPAPRAGSGIGGGSTTYGATGSGNIGSPGGTTYSGQTRSALGGSGNSMLLVGLLGGDDPYSNASTIGTMDDQTFIQHVARRAPGERMLNELVEQEATNPQVRDLARTIQADHERAIAEFRPVAQAQGILLESVFTPLERDYIQQTINEHQRKIAQFEHIMNNGTDSGVRNWAARQLPTLRAHLRQAESLAHQAALQSGAEVISPSSAAVGPGSTPAGNPSVSAPPSSGRTPGARIPTGAAASVASNPDSAVNMPGSAAGAAAASNSSSLATGTGADLSNISPSWVGNEGGASAATSSSLSTTTGALGTGGIIP